MEFEEMNQAVKNIAIQYAIDVLKNEGITDVDVDKLEAQFGEKSIFCSHMLYQRYHDDIDDTVERTYSKMIDDFDNWLSHNIISGITGILNVSDDNIVRASVGLSIGYRSVAPRVSHSIDLKTGIVYKDDMGKEIGRIVDGKFRRT